MTVFICKPISFIIVIHGLKETPQRSQRLPRLLQSLKVSCCRCRSRHHRNKHKYRHSISYSSDRDHKYERSTHHRHHKKYNHYERKKNHSNSYSYSPSRSYSSRSRSPSKSHYKFRVGEYLGRKYKVIRLLGDGTFGRVVEAERDRKIYAVKVRKE